MSVRTSGISFRAPDVRRILEGSKTSTRRLATSRFYRWVIGARLWVQEPWFYAGDPKLQPDLSLFRYYATDENRFEIHRELWQHPRDMPRMACRLLLRITDMHEEQLQEITEQGARAEGYRDIEEFGREWNRNYPEDIWSDNPRVVVIQFETKRLR